MSWSSSGRLVLLRRELPWRRSRPKTYRSNIITAILWFESNLNICTAFIFYSIAWFYIFKFFFSLFLRLWGHSGKRTQRAPSQTSRLLSQAPRTALLPPRHNSPAPRPLSPKPTKLSVKPRPLFPRPSQSCRTLRLPVRSRAINWRRSWNKPGLTETLLPVSWILLLSLHYAMLLHVFILIAHWCVVNAAQVPWRSWFPVIRRCCRRKSSKHST